MEYAVLISAEGGKLKNIPPPPQKKAITRMETNKNSIKNNEVLTQLPLLLIKQQIKMATRKCSLPPT